MAQHLVLVEHVDDVAAIPREMFGHALLVATNPGVALALERFGIAYSITSGWSTETALHDVSFGSEKLAKLADACRALDDALWSRIPQFAEAGLRPIERFFYPLDLVWDNILVCLNELEQMIAVLRPASIAIFVEQRPAPVDQLFFRQTDRLYGAVARELCRRHTIQLVEYAAPEGRPSSISGARGWCSLLIKAAWAVRDGHVGQRLRKLALRLRRRVHARANVLSLQPVCDAGALRRAGLEPWTWRAGQAPARQLGGEGLKPGSTPTERCVIDAQVDCLLAIPALGDAFSFRGMNCLDLMRARLRHLLASSVPQFWTDFQRARAVLREIGCRAVLIRNLSDQFLYAVTAAARSLRIPVVGTPHGHLGDVFDPIWKWYELPFCDHYLVHASAGQAFVAAQGVGGLQVHLTGNPYLEDIKAPQLPNSLTRLAYGLALRKPLIVFVTLPPHGLLRRLDSTTTDNHRHFAIQRRIFETIVAHRNYQVVVKGLGSDTPETAPLMTLVESLGRPDVRYVTDTSFRTFLDAADAFVLDWPSFSLIEALTRKKAIYAFNSTYAWTKEAVGLLEREIVFEQDLDRFCTRLDQDLTTGRILAERKSESAYLGRYADEFCDGRSGDRAARVVAEIATQVAA